MTARFRLRPWPLAAAVLLAVAAGHVYPQWVEDSVDCGGSWVGSLAYNATSHVVYGSSQGSNRFFAISVETNQVISSFYCPVPLEVEYDSLDNKVYVVQATGGYDSVVVVSGTTHQRIRAIPLYWAVDLQWNPDNDRLYVSMGEENRVAVIDCRTDSVLCEIPVGAYPAGLTLNRRHQKLYVRNWDGESVSIIDLNTNQVIKTIPVGTIPMSGWFSESADRYYGGDWGVTVIDGAGDSVVANLPFLSGAPNAVAGSERHDRVMVGLSYGSSDSVGVIDMQGDTVLTMLGVGGDPMSLLWSSLSDLFYCANAASDNVSVIAGDGSRVLGTIPVGNCPVVLQAAPGRRRVYVGHANTRLVYVLRDTVSGIEEEQSLTRPQPYSTLSATPNPFCQQVRLRLSRATRTTDAGVYSLDGRLVRTLQPVTDGSPDVTWVWDGTNAGGKEVAEGVYVVALSCDATIRTMVVRAR